MHTIPNVHSDKIIEVKFSSSGREIITLGRDHVIKITDANTYKEIASLESSDLSIPTGDVSFGLSPGGKYLSVGSQSGALCIFNIKE
jgi:WD40 repeat protein